MRPIQVSQWKRQLLDGASELFTRGKKSKDTGENQAKEAEMVQQIGRLQMELKWLQHHRRTKGDRVQWSTSRRWRPGGPP